MGVIDSFSLHTSLTSRQCGVLLGAMAMRHAYDAGCRKAELLAIYDDDKSHRLLKAFYKT